MDGFKQRIMGAIVLVCLAIIFIPMIFEDPHQEKTTKVLPIPAKPEVPAFTIEAPSPPDRSWPEKYNSRSLTPATGSNSETNNTETKSTQELMTVAELEAAEQQAKAEAAGMASKREATSSYKATEVLGSEGAAAAGEMNTAATKPADHSATVDALAKPAAEIVPGKAWTVQIGTFKNRPGALKIRDELMKSGTPSYTADIVSGGIAMMRVFAGPTESKEAAQKLKQKIDKRYKLQSLIVTYKAP